MEIAAAALIHHTVQTQPIRYKVSTCLVRQVVLLRVLLDSDFESQKRFWLILVVLAVPGLLTQVVLLHVLSDSDSLSDGLPRFRSRDLS